MSLLLLLAGSTAGCAATAAAQKPQAARRDAALTSSARVFVVAPIVLGSASPGNVGRDFAAITAKVAARTLSIVRERFPDAELAPGGSAAGATHLLVPVITEWTQMRTDDPIGLLVLRRSSITVRLRLMRVQPVSVVGEAVFHHRARFTTNQDAIRLLDEGFRRTVLELLGP